MDRDRLAGLLDELPDRRVLVAHHWGAVRVAIEQPGPEAGQVLAPLDLGEGLIDAAVRDHRRADEAVGGVGAEFGQEVVVGPDHFQVQVGVFGALDVPAGEAHREEQFGVYAVGDLLLYASLGVVTAGVDVLVAAPLALLVGRPAGARLPAEPARLESLADPAVTLLDALDARDPVDVTARYPLGPDVTRTIEVAVGRNQPVFAGFGRACVCHANTYKD